MKKSKQKQLSITVDQYVFDIEYDTNRNCEEYGCDCVCRCSTIDNIEIRLCNNPITVCNYEQSTINDYCIGRLLSIHGSYDVNNYYVNVCGGYYGEEIKDVAFTNISDLTIDIKHVLSLGSDLEKLKYVLLKEYSFLPAYFDNVTGIEFKSIPVKNIKIDGMQKRITSNVSVDPTKPVGVLRRVDSTKYILVDGYTRYSVLRIANVVSAVYIVLL